MNEQEIIRKLIKWWHTLKREFVMSKSVEEENYIAGELDIINLILSGIFNIDVIKTKEENLNE